MKPADITSVISRQAGLTMGMESHWETLRILNSRFEVRFVLCYHCAWKSHERMLD